MKKLLLGLVGIVCALFAVPSWANCNLFDKDTIELGKRLDDSGNITNESNGFVSAKIYVAPNTTYTWQQASIEGVYLRIGEYNSSGFVKLNKGKLLGTQTLTFTTSANTSYVLVSSYNANLDKNQLEQGDTATPYTPYNPQCATCDGTVVNYVSATGTGVQNGTPTPENPIEPVFYQQGSMVLRKVGDVADSYDATTGKITRRVGVKVFDGTENFSTSTTYGKACFLQSVAGAWGANKDIAPICTHFLGEPKTTVYRPDYTCFFNDSGHLYFRLEDNTVATFKAWLAQQYAAGTPVMLYYPLATETTEDWTETSYCETPIKIATTKYNESAFGPLNTALANAISVVDSVVSNTITQAGRIATLQAQKQTRPNDIADDNEKCPAGKKCLLVEDASGVPHWYAIQESYLPLGYTPLKYINKPSGAYTDSGIKFTSENVTIEITGSISSMVDGMFGAQDGSNNHSALLIYANHLYAGENGFVNPTIFDSDLHKIIIEANNKNITLTNYAGEVVNLSYTQSIQSRNGWYIGGMRSNDRVLTNSIGKVGIIKIWDNGNLVFHGIPAKYGEEIGFYDIVQNRFLTSMSEQKFTAGPVAE